MKVKINIKCELDGSRCLKEGKTEVSQNELRSRTKKVQDR